MPLLLHLDTSMDLVGSTSRSLTARFAGAWTATSPEHVVVRRDLHVDPLPHLAAPGLHWAPHLRTPEEVVPPEAEALQADVIAELAAADVVLVGAPMYNWSVPSTLKTWIDHVHVPGTTAPLDTPVQPFAGKPVVVVTSRGARYGPGTENPDADHEVPALRQVLGTAMGMDVRVVVVGLTLAPRLEVMAALQDEFAAGLAAAEAELDSLAAVLGRVEA